MPLSEQEQRLLEEMERSLYQNDADFVPTTGQRRGRPNYTVLVVGALIGLLGIATLVTGVVIRLPLVGVLGFAIMFVGVYLAVAPPRRMTKASEPKPGSGPAPRGQRPNTSESFMDRLNERWDKRQDGRE
jgi:DUF3040 family protein